MHLGPPITVASISLLCCSHQSLRMVDRLFEDIFEVLRLNPDGKKFDKGIIIIICFLRFYASKLFSLILELLVVTRVEAKSETCDMFMHLDVNSEVYPIKEGEKFSMALTSTLNLDGTPDSGYFTPVIVTLIYYVLLCLRFIPFVSMCLV